MQQRVHRWVSGRQRAQGWGQGLRRRDRQAARGGALRLHRVGEEDVAVARPHDALLRGAVAPQLGQVRQVEVEEVLQRLTDGQTVAAVARALNTSRATVMRVRAAQPA